MPNREKVDTSTFPHEEDCPEAELRYIRCGSGDYWVCRGCGAKGVKRGLRYEPYSWGDSQQNVGVVEDDSETVQATLGADD